MAAAFALFALNTAAMTVGYLHLLTNKPSKNGHPFVKNSLKQFVKLTNSLMS
jgi:hypothetical protein